MNPTRGRARNWRGACIVPAGEPRISGALRRARRSQRQGRRGALHRIRSVAGFRRPRAGDCDNVSDDGTIALLEDYARSDRRVALHLNDVNIGLHENMKRALELSRGTYFRWISADDWLEPAYLSACVRALEASPEAVGVTTWFTIHTDDGSSRHEEYRGEFPTSPDSARRFERMLWFFHAGDAKYDPIYGMYRRDALMRAHPLRPSERTDWLLSAELALMGPIVHVYERLAHRVRSSPSAIDRARFGAGSTPSAASAYERRRGGCIASSTRWPSRRT